MITENERRRGVARRVGSASVVAVAAAGLALSGTASAWASDVQTHTQHVHGVDQLDPDFGGNPCTGDPLTGMQRENLVDHELVKGDDIQGTFTEEAWVNLVDTSATGAVVTYTGHYTVWGDFHLNQRSQTSTFTFSSDFVGSDGSTITGHEVTQFVMRADGTVQVSFDKPNLDCGSGG